MTIEPPSIWDWVQGLSDLLFGPVVGGFVAFLITLWLWLKWGLETYRVSRRAGEKILTALRFSIQHLKRVPVPRAVFAVSATLAVLALQAAWLALTYFFICVVAYTFEDLVGDATGDKFQWNEVTGTYTLSCLLLLLVAYVMAATKHEDTVPLLGYPPAILPALFGLVMALFSALYTVLGVLLLVLSWLVGLFTGRDVAEAPWSALGILWGWVLGLAVYIALGFLAPMASTMIVSVWKNAPESRRANETA